jgi:hypothetical protein
VGGVHERESETLACGLEQRERVVREVGGLGMPCLRFGDEVVSDVDEVELFLDGAHEVAETEFVGGVQDRRDQRWSFPMH